MSKPSDLPEFSDRAEPTSLFYVLNHPPAGKGKTWAATPDPDRGPDYCDFIRAACRSKIGPCRPQVIDGECGLIPESRWATRIIVREDCASVWPEGTDAYYCETPEQLRRLLDSIADGMVPSVDEWHGGQR